MARSRFARLGIRLAILTLLSALCSAASLRASDIEELRKLALQHEQNREYAKACSHYAYILS
ncbi:MAG: hypothetical protein WEH44_02110, partial [Pirellulaceae bacterium]